MDFIADLHIHSKYSRATAKNLDLEHLYMACLKKGIQVVGTGDFTHPAWFAELREKLEPAEDGLFRLKPEITRELDKEIPPSCTGSVRFMLETEISNIYKKHDKTRKNHNLVFLPDLDAAERFNAKLDAIGNIKSDGRPILGLDARNLLEIVLETSDTGFLVPAHIWTPWFSLLGSKSGFDSLGECFDDLTDEIFAVETGLSSDPPMNWRVSDLDNLTLISNSDAHSPAKLGREANRFTTELSYAAIRSALKTGDKTKFAGTIEFYPEEGKYHMDGHRKCNVSLMPEESSRLGGICPVCGKPMTLGVLYRVNELADRPHGEAPQRHHPYVNLIPLEEIISELLNVGPKSKKVQNALGRTLESVGPEFAVLNTLPPEALRTAGIPLLDEAIQKMRANDIHVRPGYDGEFGRIRLFDAYEKAQVSGQRLLFAASPPGQKTSGYVKGGIDKEQVITRKKRAPQKKAAPVAPPVSRLNPHQEAAITDDSQALLIEAGPGTGKTFTLTRKIAWLIREKQVRPDQILAITFTRKAAAEMAERLTRLVDPAHKILTTTFHGLCHLLLKEDKGNFDTRFSVIDDKEKQRLLESLLKKSGTSLKTAQASAMISLAKQHILGPEDDLSGIDKEGTAATAPFKAIYAAYQEALALRNLMDYDDLIVSMVTRLETDTTFCHAIRDRFTYVFVDEYQDLNQGQYRIIKALYGPQSRLCAIGDVNQAIYGFRGADTTYFNSFTLDFAPARVLHLEQNYRSTETILHASHQVISAGKQDGHHKRIYSGIEGMPVIRVSDHPTALSEAVYIGKQIERLVGGTGFHSIDFNKTDAADDHHSLSFSDFAVLVRTIRDGQVIRDILKKGGIPCTVVSRNHIFSMDVVQHILAWLRLVDAKITPADLEALAGLKNSIDARTMNHYLTRLHNFSLNTAGNAQKSEDVPPWMVTAANHLRHLSPLPVSDRIHYITSAIATVKHVRSASKKNEDVIHRLIRMATPFHQDGPAFLNTLALYQDGDLCPVTTEKTTIMTMHAAKGLEFPVVFIPGCEDGLIPYRRPDGTKADMEEERRLFYVALTRARDQLFLSSAHKRNCFGKTIRTKVSPFVRTIEDNLIQQEVRCGEKEPPLKKPIQLTLF